MIDSKQAWRLEEHLPQLSAPLLVIWGAQDHILPVSHASGLADSGTGNIDVRIIDDAGHMVQMEAASEVNRLVTSFLREASTA